MTKIAWGFISKLSNKIDADDRSISDVLSDKKYTVDFFTLVAKLRLSNTVLEAPASHEVIRAKIFRIPTKKQK